jgi:hypothetical protein
VGVNSPEGTSPEEKGTTPYEQGVQGAPQPPPKSIADFPYGQLRDWSDLPLPYDKLPEIFAASPREGPFVAGPFNVPVQVLGIQIGTNTVGPFLMWAENGHIVGWLPIEEVPPGPSKHGDWWIWSDDRKRVIEVAHKYPEDPQVVASQVETPFQRRFALGPDPRIVADRVEAARELNRDTEVWLGKGNSLSEAYFAELRLRKDILGQLVVAVFKAFQAQTVFEQVIAPGINSAVPGLFRGSPARQTGGAPTEVPGGRPLKGGAEARIPGEVGRLAEKVFSNVVDTPQNPGAKNGGRFATPFGNVEPDFVPAVDSELNVVSARESAFAAAHDLPSINDALLVADSKYVGVFEDQPPVLTFGRLSRPNQVRGMIWLAQFTKGRAFVVLGKAGTTVGKDIQDFANSWGVSVSVQTSELVK